MSETMTSPTAKFTESELPQHVLKHWADEDIAEHLSLVGGSTSSEIITQLKAERDEARKAAEHYRSQAINPGGFRAGEEIRRKHGLPWEAKR